MITVTDPKFHKFHALMMEFWRGGSQKDLLDGLTAMVNQEVAAAKKDLETMTAIQLEVLNNRIKELLARVDEEEANYVRMMELRDDKIREVAAARGHLRDVLDRWHPPHSKCVSIVVRNGEAYKADSAGCPGCAAARFLLKT